jgi:carbohydrate-selective porin OprB
MTMRSMEAAFGRENHLRGRFQDLVLAYNGLEDYSNELHEKVHQLYYQLHPMTHQEPRRQNVVLC